MRLYRVSRHTVGAVVVRWLPCYLPLPSVSACQGGGTSAANARCDHGHTAALRPRCGSHCWSRPLTSACMAVTSSLGGLHVCGSKMTSAASRRGASRLLPCEHRVPRCASDRAVPVCFSGSGIECDACGGAAAAACNTLALMVRAGLECWLNNRWTASPPGAVFAGCTPALPR